MPIPAIWPQSNIAGVGLYFMKWICAHAVGLALLFISTSLTGCQSEKNITKLGHGYEEVRHPGLVPDNDNPPRVSLQHRNADGKVIPIWPALSGPAEVVHSNLVVFVGDKAFLDPEKNIHPRLFAVEAPALPLDITDETLWRWSRANGKSFDRAMERLCLISATPADHGLNVHLEFLFVDGLRDDKDWPDTSDLKLDWSQLAQIIQAVKTKGTIEKDLRWKTRYIGEVY